MSFCGPQATRPEHVLRGSDMREHGKAQFKLALLRLSQEPAAAAAPRPTPATLSWSMFSLKGKYGTGRAVDFAHFHRAVLARLWQLEMLPRKARPTCSSMPRVSVGMAQHNSSRGSSRSSKRDCHSVYQARGGAPATTVPSSKLERLKW